MKPIRTLLLLTCTLAAIQNAAAIYEDQAGTYDWYRAHLGHVHNLYISRKQHVFAASQDATVARLSINDGSIVWRRVQDAPGTPASLIDLIMLPKEDGFVTVHNSDDATMLRVWRAGNGQLMWEAPLHMEGLGAPGLSAAAVGVDDTKGTVVVLGLAAGQIKVGRGKGCCTLLHTDTHTMVSNSCTLCTYTCCLHMYEALVHECICIPTTPHTCVLYTIYIHTGTCIVGQGAVATGSPIVFTIPSRVCHGFQQ